MAAARIARRRMARHAQGRAAGALFPDKRRRGPPPAGPRRRGGRIRGENRLVDNQSRDAARLARFGLGDRAENAPPRRSAGPLATASVVRRGRSAVDWLHGQPQAIGGFGRRHSPNVRRAPLLLSDDYFFDAMSSGQFEFRGPPSRPDRSTAWLVSRWRSSSWPSSP